MSRKINLCICLSSEQIESLEQKAKEFGLSRSATIGRLLIEPLDNQNKTNLPDGLIQQITNKLDEFYQKLDKSILDDHQGIIDAIHTIPTKILSLFPSHPEGNR